MVNSNFYGRFHRSRRRGLGLNHAARPHPSFHGLQLIIKRPMTLTFHSSARRRPSLFPSKSAKYRFSLRRIHCTFVCPSEPNADFVFPFLASNRPAQATALQIRSAAAPMHSRHFNSSRLCAFPTFIGTDTLSMPRARVSLCERRRKLSRCASPRRTNEELLSRRMCGYRSKNLSPLNGLHRL